MIREHRGGIWEGERKEGEKGQDQVWGRPERHSEVQENVLKYAAVRDKGRGNL